MKNFRYFHILLPVLISVSLSASPVTPERAARTASEFFGGDDGLVRDDSSPKGFYIFNRKSGGFVLISADDSAIPVLGYSFTGHFSLRNAPENLACWSELTSSAIALSSKSKAPSDSRLLALWDAPLELSRAGTGQYLIETATWNQREPFNHYAPVVDNAATLAGCVPLSMAIIMRHFRWPAAGTGYLPSYTYTTDKKTSFTVPDRSLGDRYEWDNMPLHHVASDNYAPAALIRDCGISVMAEYNEKGTSAVTSDAVIKMMQHFSYSKAAVMDQRYYYRTHEWMEKIRAEISAGNPVLYSAFSSNDSGHAFIVDGFDDSYSFHINWGWGGECNGFFSIDCFYPYTDKSEAEFGFYYRHAAAFGLVPDKSGSSTYSPCLRMKGYDLIGGLELESGTIGRGSSFSLAFGLCVNRGNSLYDGAVRVGLVDSSGNLREFVGEAENIVSLQRNCGVRITGYNARITLEPQLGDELKVFYLADGSWIQMPYSNEGDTVGSLSAGPAFWFIRKDETYFAGQNIQLELAGGDGDCVSLSWYFDGKACSATVRNAASGKHSIKAVISHSDGSRETLFQEIEVL